MKKNEYFDVVLPQIRSDPSLKREVSRVMDRLQHHLKRASGKEVVMMPATIEGLVALLWGFGWCLSPTSITAKRAAYWLEDGEDG